MRGSHSCQASSQYACCTYSIENKEDLLCSLSRSVSPSVEHLARAAREDLHLRASVIMQVPDPAVSTSQPNSRDSDDDDVFYLLLQKQLIGYSL